MIAMHESVQDILAPNAFGYCERILCLYAPGQAPSWWLAQADPERAFFALGSGQTATPVGQAAGQDLGRARRGVSSTSLDAPAGMATTRRMTLHDEPTLTAQSAPSPAKPAEPSPGTSSAPTAARSLRLREVLLDQVRWAVEQAVSEGYRPHVFVPRPCDWPRVYDALGRYQDFARLWICGRDDRIMTDLLHQPSAEVLEVQRSGGYLVVPDPEYGKALDQVLSVCLDDFLADEECAPEILGPGRVRYERASRLNAFRILEAEVDRIAGEVVLRQLYVSGDPQGPREICELPIAIAGEEPLLFVQGICRGDRAQDAQVAAVCKWLGIPPLLTLAQPAVAPPFALSQALTQSKERVLSELEQKKRRGEFLDWMAAWRKLYFAGTPLRPTAEKSLQWVTRALEEVVREFGLLDVLRPRAMPLPALGAGAILGAMREQEGKADLEGLLGDVAEAFAPPGDE